MSQPPSQSFKGSENFSTIKGATGGAPEPSESQNPTTLPPDFKLSNTKADSKGHEHTIPNEELTYTDGEATGPTAGRGDDMRQSLQSHDIQIPPIGDTVSGGAPELNETGSGNATNTAGQGQGGAHTRSTGVQPE